MGLQDDDFLIGSVGCNYENDQKGFGSLIEAYKLFKTKYQRSALYIHTDIHSNGVCNWDKVARSMGVSVMFPDQLSLYLNRFGGDHMRDLYNAFDLFVLPTKGEGFGIPIVEAQMCGTPVCVSHNTTGPELCRTGTTMTERVEDIEWFMEHFRGRPVNRRDSRDAIMDYSWDSVWPNYWEPVIKTLEGKL